MGICISVEKTRHGKLQCDRDIAPELLPLYSASPVVHDRFDRASVDYGAYQEHSTP